MKESNHSPFPGCFIFLIALGIFGFVTVYSLWNFKQLSHKITQFTHEKPQLTSVFTSQDSRFSSNLDLKIKRFREGIHPAQSSTIALTLTRDELNFSLANYPLFSDLKGRFYITEMTPEFWIVQIDFPIRHSLNRKKLRYLHTKLKVKPKLLNGEMTLNIISTAKNESPLPKEFLAHLSPYRPLQIYLKTPVLGNIIPGFSQLKLQSNQLKLTHSGKLVFVKNDSRYPRLVLTLLTGGLLTFAFLWYVKQKSQRKRLES